MNQGGAALSFDMPAVTRDVVTVAEGVVIFVCGMLDGVRAATSANLCEPYGRRRRGRQREPALVARGLDGAARRTARSCGTRRALSERSGVVDVGLEGKMLGAAFVGAAIASLTGSAAFGLGAGIAAALLLALLQASLRSPPAAIRSYRAWHST